MRSAVVMQDRITASPTATTRREPQLEAALEEGATSVPPDFIAQGEAALKLAVGKQAARHAYRSATFPGSRCWGAGPH